MPLGPIGQNFWPKYDFGDFARKLVDTLFKGPRHNWKNLWQEKKKKKTWLKFVPECPEVLLATNIDRISILSFLYENL